MQHVINEGFAFGFVHLVPDAAALGGNKAGAFGSVTRERFLARPMLAQQQAEDFKLLFGGELLH